MKEINKKNDEIKILKLGFFKGIVCKVLNIIMRIN